MNILIYYTDTIWICLNTKGVYCKRKESGSPWEHIIFLWLDLFSEELSFAGGSTGSFKSCLPYKNGENILSVSSPRKYRYSGRIQDHFCGNLFERKETMVRFDQIIVLTVRIREKKAWANSVDPVQTPQNAASDQGIHCLPLIQQFNTHL